jgi:hypothetical protein
VGDLVAVGAKVAAFAVQYVAFRIPVTNRLCYRPRRQLGLGREMRYTATRAHPDPGTISGFAKKS